jgi:hypothetical protein
MENTSYIATRYTFSGSLLSPNKDVFGSLYLPQVPSSLEKYDLVTSKPTPNI